MAHFHTSVHVQRSSSSTCNGQLPGYDWRNSFDILFEQRESIADAPRPVKRRKLEDTAESVDDICAAKVDVDLHIATSTSKTFSVDQTVIRRTPIGYLGLEPSEEQDDLCFYISRDADRYDHSVSVIVLADEAQELRKHLSHLCPLPSARPPRSNAGSSSSHHMWTDSIFEERADGSYVLSIKVWCSTGLIMKLPSKFAGAHTSNALQYLLSHPNKASNQPPSSQFFYEVVHAPDASLHPLPSIQHSSVTTELFPFQKRAVSWLLTRERVHLNEDGTVTDLPNSKNTHPQSYKEYFDIDGRPFYFSHLLGHVIREPIQADSLHRHLHGGILAEEMGLGKTVELIDLLCLHRRTANLGATVYDAYSNENVTVSAATLIVSPPAILEQWISEIKSHAPALRVLHYTGLRNSSNDVLERLLEQDVVITTYGILASEIHYADEKPNRNLRHKKIFVAKRSPLVKILWWRVCLDEAQMVESGVSSAARVARRIPRCNAWAVTGTPLKSDIKDLLGLMIFLRYEPFCDVRIWQRMTTHRDVFREIFSSIAMRHTKAQIRSELQLPPQKRVVVTVPFTAIEEQHYKEMFDEMCAEVGLDKYGAPVHAYWDPDSDNTIARMRHWLTRLRQTCLHPEVGERNKRALGRKGGALRTVDEVLQVMIEANETAIRSEERVAISAKLIQGHLYLFAHGVNKEQALNVYFGALETATETVVECRDQLSDEAVKLRKSSNSDDHANSESGEEPEDSKSDRLSAQRNRLRNALELQHQSAFFVATAYYNVKMQKTDGNGELQEYKDVEKLESEYYDAAKAIRKEMLRDIADNTQKLIANVRMSVEGEKRALPQFLMSSGYGGIESQKVSRAIDDLSILMDRQAAEIEKWRDKLAELLSDNLLDQEDADLTGEEYETTLKNQDEQYVYLFVLRAAVADRSETMTGNVNALVFHETKEALKQANKGEGHAPQLMKSALQSWMNMQPQRGPMLPMQNYVPPNEQSLIGTVADMRGMITSLRSGESTRGSSRAANEASLLENELRRLQQTSRDQFQALKSLEKDVDLYRSTMNSRLEYYRQLQAISDTVQPYQEHESESLDVKKLKHEQTIGQRQMDKVRGLRTKRKFLHHLKNRQGGREERRPCSICLTPFEIGVLTVCAHEFCKDCISIWISDHKNCPMCKKPLRAMDLHNITYAPREMHAAEEHHGASPSSSDMSESSGRSSIYSNISEETLNDIKAIDLPTSYSSKLDTIARHLLYLRASEPGTKTVLFSQYRDFLEVLGKTLRRCKISYTEISSKSGIHDFKEDPAIECFFLHAKADSSGLNLVNATHVILCEPLINTAVELQAISRVHRIGQKRATSVWMYVVADSVEEAIYDISVNRRLQLMGSKSDAHSTEPSRVGTPALESKLDVFNSKELQSAPISKLMAGGGGGEIVPRVDLWSCLFGKVKAEPSEETMKQIEETVGRHLLDEATDERNAVASR